MPPVPAPGVFAGAANVIAVIVLVIEFWMPRQALLGDQLRLYAARSLAVSILAVFVAAHPPPARALRAAAARRARAWATPPMSSKSWKSICIG